MRLSGGCEAMRGYYQPLRLVGAQARRCCWRSPPPELKSPGRRAHHRTQQGGACTRSRPLAQLYREVAAAGRLPDPLPLASDADLKPLDQCRYIGRPDIDRIDVPAKVNGTARFGIDVRIAGHAVRQSAAFSGSGREAGHHRERRGQAREGVTRIVHLPYGVGIIGESYDATPASQGPTQRRPEQFIAGQALQQRPSGRRYYRDVGRDLAQAGVASHTQSDAAKLRSRAPRRVIAVDYLSDHVHHATMEPMKAAALVSGDTVEVWAPTQGPTATQGFAARTAGTTPDKVKIPTTLLGGGFGRGAETGLHH